MKTTPLRALPHVGGQTTRFRAEPAKLTGVGLRVMAASGNFGARRGAATSMAGLWFGALALLLAAGVIAITGSNALTSDRSSEPAATTSSSPSPAQVQSQGANERVPSVAPALVTESATTANTVPVQEAVRASALDSQDRFEINRFHRRGAVAVWDIAPAAGPTQR